MVPPLRSPLSIFHNHGKISCSHILCSARNGLLLPIPPLSGLPINEVTEAKLCGVSQALLECFLL